MGAWSPARAKVILVVPIVLVFIVVVILASQLTSTHTAVNAAPHGTARSARQLPAYRPLRVTPPKTALQRSANAYLRENSSSVGFTEAQAAALPNAATSSAFPAIDAADSSSSSAYALAFTQEVLDVNFATSTREELLAWASYNNAPNSFVPIPVLEDLKILPRSLTAPPGLVPTSSEWRELAKSGARWRVSGLAISVNPIWTQLLGTGWRPTDPLMVMYDVSGTLTVTAPGRASVTESIDFALTLGGASWHPGYGAVAVNAWTVN